MEPIITLAPIPKGGLIQSDNLAECKKIWSESIHLIDEDLKSDNDFADAMDMVKKLAESEDKFRTASDGITAQLVDVTRCQVMLADMREMARNKRLCLEKRIKDKRASVLKSIVDKAMVGIPLNHPLARAVADAVKGKRSIQSAEEAAEMAAAKVHCMVEECDSIIADADPLDVADKPSLRVMTADVLRSELLRRSERRSFIESQRAQAAELAAVRATTIAAPAPAPAHEEEDGKAELSRYVDAVRDQLVPLRSIRLGLTTPLAQKAAGNFADAILIAFVEMKGAAL